MSRDTPVDAYGVPTHAFGSQAPPELFEVLGRILAVHGKIEYMRDRLNDLTSAEAAPNRKIEQFLARLAAGQTDRNAIVHSYWVLGAHTTNPDVIFAIRYKTRKQISGKIATVSISDAPDSEREQDYSQYTLDDLNRLLRSSVVTMRIGEQAYSEIMLEWAAEQISKTST